METVLIMYLYLQTCELILGSLAIGLFIFKKNNFCDKQKD